MTGHLTRRAALCAVPTLLAAPLLVPPLAASPRARDYRWNDTDYRTHVTAADSGGRQGVFEAQVSAPGGPPLHVHDDADELVVVLDGEIRTVVAGVEARHRAGDAVFIPRGVAHTYRVTSAHGARLLAVMTPGGFEAFFEAASREGLRVPQDMERLQALAATHHLRFVGPPLGAG